MKTDSVGGIRLAPKPVHLGHFVGTFAACSAIGPTDQLLYIIKDTEPFYWPDKGARHSAIVTITRVARLLGEGFIVKPILASILMKESSLVQNVLLDVTNYNAMVRRHFKKDNIRSGEYNGTLRNFLFLHDEAVVFTFLQVVKFFSNMDNERIIHYVRESQSRFDHRLYGSSQTVRTELKSFPNLSFLPGEDYNRMASKNGNVVSVLSDRKRIERLCSNICKLGRYFETRQDKLEQWRLEGKISLDDDFAAFAYLRVFSGVGELDRFRVQERGKETLPELESIIFESVWKKMTCWQERFQVNGESDQRVYDTVISDSEVTAKRFGSFWEKLIVP